MDAERWIRDRVLLMDFFFQAEDGRRDPLWSRVLGDVYKRRQLARLRRLVIGHGQDRHPIVAEDYVAVQIDHQLSRIHT